MIGWLLLLFAAALPPLELYPEENIQPKWMASIWVVSFMFAICLGKKTNLQSKGLPLATCAAVYYIFIVHPFRNPSVLAMHLCMLLPFVHQAHKKGRKLVCWFAWSAEFLLIAILLLSQCRSGYLCLFAFFLFIFLPHKAKFYITSMAILAILAVSLTSNYKKGSSQGRLFILQNTMEIIKERPFTGYGPNGFRKTYMKQQARYFMQRPESKYAWLADDIRHPLNEFLYMAVNWGMAGVVLLLLLLVAPFFIPWRSTDYPWRQSLVTVCIFSFFSYPLSYPLTWAVILFNWIPVFRFPPIRKRYILLPCTLLFSFFVYKDYYLRRWGQVSHLSKNGHPRAMMAYYKPLYAHFQRNPKFLYDYAIESFYATEFRQADRLSDECKKYMSSYDLSLLQGDICMQLKEYKRAISCYQEAHMMCPVRFAPLSGLFDIYLAMGDTLSADSIRRIIMSKEIKVPSKEVIDIKNRVENRGQLELL